MNESTEYVLNAINGDLDDDDEKTTEVGRIVRRVLEKNGFTVEPGFRRSLQNLLHNRQ